jgi:hypothetical protein
MAIRILDEGDVRRIVHDEARPLFVHQRSAERVLGLPGRDFLRGAHAGHFAWTKERRLIIAKTSDVVAWLERRLAYRDTKPANDEDVETIAFARVGARRVAAR